SCPEADASMEDNRRYPELRRRLSPGWWTATRHYAMYMIREWTSLFVALYSLIFIYGLSLWATGSRADFLSFLKNSAVVGFSLVALAFTLYYAATWFYLLVAISPVTNGTRDPSFLVTGHLLGALFIFVTIAGSLYHGIFRFQSALTEVGLLKYRRALEAVGYFIIFAGIILLAYYLGTWYLNGTIR